MGQASRIGITLQALGGRLGAQWERERRDTLFLMGATALAVLPHAGHLPAWVTIAFFLLFVWRLGLVLSGRALPGAAVGWLAGLACLAGVLAQYQTLLGREPGVAVLVLLLGLKLMEMRARRDLFVVIFLCFFVLLTSFFYAQTPWAAGGALLAVLALVAAMLTMQYGEREAPVGRRLRSAAVLLGQALPLAVLIFVLFPRLQTPLWGQPGEAPGARTGLSDTMRPGAVALLAESEEVAFRVRFDGAAPARALLYWRGPVLGDFDGTLWREFGSTGGAPRPPRIELPATAEPIGYTVTLEPSNQRWLLALDVPVALAPVAGRMPLVTPELLVLAHEPVTAALRYRFESSTTYRLGREEDPAALAASLALPAGYNPRTLALAADWRAAETEPARIVARALEMYRSEPFWYTLRPPLLGRDSVDDFLFGTRAGFCEHFAASFVVLMRAAGIPARVVTGYQGAERQPDDGSWIVRQSDAHAWAEVWIAGEGWTRVDPTGAVAPERIASGERARRDAPGFADAFDGSLSLLHGLSRRLDALSHAWTEWVLSYETSHQKRLLARFGFSFDSWHDLAGLLAAALMLTISAVALFTLHPRTPRDAAEAAYAAFCAKLARRGVARASNETARQLLLRADAALDPAQRAQAQRIVTLYNALRYAAPGEQTVGVRHLRQLVRAFG